MNNNMIVISVVIYWLQPLVLTHIASRPASIKIFFIIPLLLHEARTFLLNRMKYL